jgi:hypothetical protein
MWCAYGIKLKAIEHYESHVYHCHLLGIDPDTDKIMWQEPNNSH